MAGSSDNSGGIVVGALVCRTDFSLLEIFLSSRSLVPSLFIARDRSACDKEASRLGTRSRRHSHVVLPRFLCVVNIENVGVAWGRG